MSKRKGKQRRDLARRKRLRAPYAKVLIVCEGGKTEPNYFLELRYYHEIESANIEITGESGSSPCSVVKYAKQLYNEEKNLGDPFDRVYCVFDKDEHSDYNTALDIIRRSLPKNTFFSITSVPCFEYWLLLHFEFSTKPYNRLPNNSAANQVLCDLKKHLPHYEKKSKGIYTQLFKQLEYAKSNATKANTQAANSNTDNPSTYIHDLVQYLQGIKNS